ncbi:DUF6776 family protein [Aquimonas sp.]|jgi:hypothetical protein|uniref:DUF6776 family protein n=1 Tax=Aquimonas sp. TaxID=1872588 RepID=UPI0037BF412C
MSNPSPFVIVPRSHAGRRFSPWLWLLWLLSLAAVGMAVYRLAPTPAGSANEGPSTGELTEQVGSLEDRLARLRQRNVILKRSDEVSRTANQELQRDLADRDERIAALEADVAFYERLVGGSAQRQGLSIHSLSMQAADSGAHHFRLTLTQNVKTTQLSRGSLRLSIEGVRDGQLAKLEWSDLLQVEQAGQAAPIEFAFKYFQQIEGTVMLPTGFTPHSVKVSVDGESGRSERSIPWADTQPATATVPPGA